MDINKINLYFNTIRFLKIKQLYYRLINRFKRKYISYNNIEFELSNISISWSDYIKNSISYDSINNSFKFLNKEKKFPKNNIDWNFSNFGKLWTYNLNYFDYLNQTLISKENGIRLINQYIDFYPSQKDGSEPYPISLRTMNWVKFLSKNKINDNRINHFLFRDCVFLYENIEYHLLGNHLLENAFALLFSSYYFQNDKFYMKSKNILTKELNEQILFDGGHFELSPMYHQIMLFRILDCIQLIKLNNWKNDKLLILLKLVSSKMLSWLCNITFNNGDIPMINDSTFKIAPTTKKIVDYGKHLNIYAKKNRLSDSGYRMFKNQKYELFMDLGDVGASYQPGHVHSDTFNFILYKNNQPFIVDTGISTYEKNKRRQKERSTSSHNTITINHHEQTEVWGGFRVAKRAKILSFAETINQFSASHDGYKNLGIIHNRKFIADKDSVHIYDKLNKQHVFKQKAHFHFHPSLNNILIKNSSVFFEKLDIELLFDGDIISIKKESYEYSNGFNLIENALKLIVVFNSNLETTIKL